MDGDIQRSFNSDFYIITPDSQHPEDDLAVDDDILILLSRQDEHVIFLFVLPSSARPAGRTRAANRPA